jgi:hypothetical protein
VTTDTDPAPTQLGLAREGYCTKCTKIKLSVADRDGICLYCTEEQQKLLALRAQAKRRASAASSTIPLTLKVTL